MVRGGSSRETYKNQNHLVIFPPENPGNQDSIIDSDFFNTIHTNRSEWWKGG